MSNLSRRQIIGGALVTGLSALSPALTSAESAPAPAQPPTPSVQSPAAAVQPRLTGIRRVIIDTDPGNDDALALILGLRSPSLTVEAVTVCPGNLGPDY